jgi:uncharacterized membrane protein
MESEGEKVISKKAINIPYSLFFLLSASYAQAGYMGMPSGSIGGLFLLMILLALLSIIFIIGVFFISRIKPKIKKRVGGWK